MSSIYSAELAASASDLNEPGCEQSLSVKSNPIAAQSCESIGPTSQSTTMCELSPLTGLEQTELFPMSSVAASPVKTSALLAMVQELTGLEADYGASTPELLARFDPGSSSWKTFQHCLVEGLDEFSETWPRSGMTQNGTAYQLPPLAPSIAATESGLWPTPAVMDTGLTTDLSKIQERRERVKAAGINGNGFGLSLGEAVRMWPTPTVNGNHNRKGASPTSGDGLATAVKMWPTPCARDFRSSMKLETVDKRAVQSSRGVNLSEHVQRIDRNNGALNPQWVEWLMGFPLGWTALEPSEMPLSRKSRKSSAGQS